MENEKRLIDANALQRRICGAKCGCEYEDCGCEGDCQFDFFISNAATVNAVEVVHGHWVPFYEEVPIYNSGGFTERRQTGWICSKCGKGFTQLGHQRYCGDCGAKMDGVQE